MCDKCITSWASLFLLFIGEEWAPGVAGAEAKKVLLEKYRIVFWRKTPIQNASTAPILWHKIHIVQDVCVCITMHCVSVSNIHHTAMHCVSLSNIHHHALFYCQTYITSPCLVLLSNIYCIIMHCFVIQHTSWCSFIVNQTFHHHALF